MDAYVNQAGHARISTTIRQSAGIAGRKCCKYLDVLALGQGLRFGLRQQLHLTSGSSSMAANGHRDELLAIQWALLDAQSRLPMAATMHCACAPVAT